MCCSFRSLRHFKSQTSCFQIWTQNLLFPKSKFSFLNPKNKSLGVTLNITITGDCVLTDQREVGKKPSRLFLWLSVDKRFQWSKCSSRKLSTATTYCITLLLDFLLFPLSIILVFILCASAVKHIYTVLFRRGKQIKKSASIFCAWAPKRIVSMPEHGRVVATIPW